MRVSFLCGVVGCEDILELVRGIDGAFRAISRSAKLRG